jgi:hypothetical protein
MNAHAAIELVEFDDVEAIRDGGLALLCRVHGRDVWIPTRKLAETSYVRKVGDRGKLVIPRWLAVGLALIDGSDMPGAIAPRGGPSRAFRRRRLAKPTVGAADRKPVAEG